MSENPIIAIMYDFDRTLSVEDMQNFKFIPKLGMEIGEFWNEANTLAKNESMDGILAYMFTMVQKAKEKNINFSHDFLVDTGRDIKFFPGVEDWFDRINKFGEENGVTIEHYVISSGLNEIISGCAIRDKFKKIYASEFLYDDNGTPIWAKIAVNYTNKTQFIYRINKGILDISEDKALNASMPDNSKRVPFRNMIYIGDGLSDVPCMKMVKAYGGQSIAVYGSDVRIDPDKFKNVQDLLKNDRVDYIFEADYTDGSQLDTTMKNIIKKMSINDTLIAESAKQKGSISE